MEEKEILRLVFEHGNLAIAIEGDTEVGIYPSKQFLQETLRLLKANGGSEDIAAVVTDTREELVKAIEIHNRTMGIEKREV